MATPAADSSLGDALLCPVCLEMFEGRILQCSQGHAVCEKCQQQLTECPHCRGSYMGTRNYVLEEVIDKLKKIGGTNLLASMHQKTAAKSTNEAPPNANTIPLPPNPLVTSSSSGTITPPTNRLLHILDEFLFDEADFWQTAAQMHNTAPLQPKGFFACRMIGCDKSLPACRLLNHIRYHHKQNFVKHATDMANPQNDVDFNFTLMPNANKCLALRIPKFGLFFLIWQVRPAANNSHILSSWVQGVFPNRAARAFRFSMELKLNNSTVTYRDFVYGAQSTDGYIRDEEQCLTFKMNRVLQSAVQLKVTIGHTIGLRNVPRNSNSVVTMNVPVLQPAVVAVRGGRGRGRGRWNNRRRV